MYVDARDWRPSSLLKGAMAAIGIFHVLVGLVLTAATHIVVIGLISFLRAPPETWEEVTELAPEELVEEESVEAQLIKLGSPLDPRHLPDRPAPTLATEPRRQQLYSENNNITRRDGGFQQPEAVEDLLQKLGQAVDRERSVEELRDVEGGHEFGVPEGDPNAELNSRNIWATALVRFFRAGLDQPSTVPDDPGLVVRVSVRISSDLRVTAANVTGTSGHPDWDSAVRAHIASIQSSGRQVPAPPADIAEWAFGHSHTVRFYPRRGRSSGDTEGGGGGGGGEGGGGGGGGEGGGGGGEGGGEPPSQAPPPEG